MKKCLTFLLFGVMLSCTPPPDRLAQPVESFDLSEVRLLKSSFLEAQQTDLAYILEMDVDRLLAPYLLEAGLEPREAPYGSWESGGLNGHIGGHYLSALAMMYAATGEDTLQHRLDYMIRWLERCQKANGNGYVGGVPDGKRLWTEISEGNVEADYFSLNGGWVPLYNMHKLFAGLRDAYQFAGREKALEIWMELSDWWVDLLSGLSDAQVQQMLKSEHGGLNEVFADLYGVTGKVVYLDMARRLSHQMLLGPLLKRKDSLTGMHANTQIPKVIGYQRVAEVNCNESWSEAARFFWETVVENRTISIGGNSVREHFHDADNFSSMVSSEQGPETCNTYNMLRLSMQLFLSTGEMKYLDYYERAQYNHILSSQHPEGGFVYFTPARPRHYRVYSQPHAGMWCCVGSGLENHTRYGELIYARQGSDLMVNLFIPSELRWEAQGLRITQRNVFPEKPETTLLLTLKESKKFRVRIRRPEWVLENFMIVVNGEEAPFTLEGGYATVHRRWADGDEIVVRLPMDLQLESLPDGSPWVSFVYGPVVLAAASDTTDLEGLMAQDKRMDHVAQGKFYPADQAPVLVGHASCLAQRVQKEADDAMVFSLKGCVYPEQFDHLKLVPFYQIHDARYMLYWPIADSSKFEQMTKNIQAEEAERAALTANTVDYVSPGEQQPEADHLFKGENTYMGYSNERYWRSGDGWFSYQLRNDHRQATSLRVVFESGDETDFKIYMNGGACQLRTTVNKEGVVMGICKLKEVPDSDRFEVRFEAVKGRSIPKILDVRLLK